MAPINPYASIEQKCIEPGLWHIDGHVVRRHSSGWWSVTLFGRVLHKARRLSECRQWIADQ